MRHNMKQNNSVAICIKYLYKRGAKPHILVDKDGSYKRNQPIR